MKYILFILRNINLVGGSAKVYSELFNRLPPSKVFVLARKQESRLNGNQGKFAFREVASLGIQDKKASWLNYIMYLIGLIGEIRLIRKKFPFEIVCLEHSLEIEAAIIAFFFKKSVLFYSHGEEFNSFQWSYNRLKSKLLYPYFNRNQHIYFIAVSSATKLKIGNAIGAKAMERTAIIFNGVSIPKSVLDRENIKQIKDEHCINDKFVILTVSRFDKRKGHHLVLPLLKRLVEKYSNIVYVTIGEGECLSQFKDEVQAYGLENYVRCLGYVSDDIKNMYYQLADVFLLLCHTDESGAQEGFGLVFLEANSYGVPVLAGNSGGVSDSVSNGVSGFIVDPFNQEEIYGRISQLISDREELNKLRISSKQWAARFSWDKMANQFQDFIETVR